MKQEVDMHEEYKSSRSINRTETNKVYIHLHQESFSKNEQHEGE